MPVPHEPDGRADLTIKTAMAAKGINMLIVVSKTYATVQFVTDKIETAIEIIKLTYVHMGKAKYHDFKKQEGLVGCFVFQNDSKERWTVYKESVVKKARNIHPEWERA